MALQRVSASFTFSSLSHDAWTEAYVGGRRIAYEILPDPPKRQGADDGALCKLAIVGAHHMMEVALFRLLKAHVGPPGSGKPISPAAYDDASYWKALNQLTVLATGAPINLTAEPFLSTERLRDRRNSTVHKESAVATVAMARSALFSAVEGTQALFRHFQAPFPYQPFLNRWPVHVEQPFSRVKLP